MKQLTTNLTLALSLAVLGACASTTDAPQAPAQVQQPPEDAAKKEEEQKKKDERHEWRLNFPHGRSTL